MKVIFYLKCCKVLAELCLYILMEPRIIVSTKYTFKKDTNLNFSLYFFNTFLCISFSCEMSAILEKDFIIRVLFLRFNEFSPKMESLPRDAVHMASFPPRF